MARATHDDRYLIVFGLAPIFAAIAAALTCG